MSIKDCKVCAEKSYCNCLGYFEYKEWNIDINTDLPLLHEGSIKILHRSMPKVYYTSVNEALEDGYTDFDQNEFQDPKGEIFVFSGIKSDARKLWLNIRNKEEKRVKMVRCQTLEEQRKEFEDQDLIIWTCGYRSKAIKVIDEEGEEV